MYMYSDTPQLQRGIQHSMSQLTYVEVLASVQRSLAQYKGLVRAICTTHHTSHSKVVPFELDHLGRSITGDVPYTNTGLVASLVCVCVCGYNSNSSGQVCVCWCS